MEALPTNGDVECMDRLAIPYSLRIQCAFLGWPDSMHAPLRDWITQRNAVMAEGDQQAQRDVAMAFDGVIRRILAERRALGDLPPDDPTASLMRETLNGQPLKISQSAYTLVNLMARYDISDKLFVAANLNNLTNEKYLTSRYWADQGYYGAPRNATVSLNWKY